MTEALEEIRAVRDDLHRKAFALNGVGRSEAAQALWGVVESLDALLNRLTERRHP